MKKRGNGQGSITKRPNGLLRGSYTIGGKRKSIYQHVGESKYDFNKRFLEIIYSINSGTYIDKSKDTIKTIAERYIRQKYDDGITSGRSFKRNIDTLNLLEKCLGDTINENIQNITSDMIERSKINMRKYSESTINKMWILLNKVFKIAYSRRKITYNIMEDETLNKPISMKERKNIKALTVEEENKLLKILDNEEKDHPYRNIIKLQLATGMRLGEVLARKISDIDFDLHTMKIDNTITLDEYDNVIIGKHTKTYSRKSQIDKGARIIPITTEIENIIRDEINKGFKNDFDLLFWNNSENKLISVSNVNCYLSRLNKKYKIANTLQSHILRHTRITRLNECGVDIMVIQTLVGHTLGSNITRDHYITITDEYIKSEMNKVAQ